jgi:hypothetical protein
VGERAIRGEYRRRVEHRGQDRPAGRKDSLCLFEYEDLDELLRQMRVFAEHAIPLLADPG